MTIRRKKECRNCMYSVEANLVKRDEGCYCKKRQIYHGLNSVCKDFKMRAKKK